MRRELLRLSLPFREPFLTAGGAVTDRELLLLRLEDDGVRGCGEAAPFEPYDGTPIERVAAALLSGEPDAVPQARAAEEMARLDLEARRDGRPLGEPGAEVIPVNATLGAGPPEETAARAAEAVRRGYACVKLKVGLPDDEHRVAAVRAAVGPWPGLRLDANGAWAADEAVKRIRALAVHDLELVEQPCQTLSELAAVRRAVEVPIAADEPIRTADDVREAVRAEACDAVCVKLAPSGGFLSAREALRAAADAGLGAIVSSTLDGPWGIAAGLQLAAGEGVTLACGLATLELFDGPLARALPAPAGGTLAVPRSPGLGVDVPDDVLAEAVVERLA